MKEQTTDESICDECVTSTLKKVELYREMAKLKPYEFMERYFGAKFYWYQKMYLNLLYLLNRFIKF